MNIPTRRVESFSDNVIAIIITIMVFEIRLPEITEHLTHWDVWTHLQPLLPHFIAYLISFIVLGIMWVNHHHMFHMVQTVDEKLLWLNLHQLFWMSLIPFPTAMLGENPFLPEACLMYGAVMLMNAIAFRALWLYVDKYKLMYTENNTMLNKEIDEVNKRVRVKNLAAIAAYLISIPLAYISVYLSYICFLVLPSMFFIPDGVTSVYDGRKKQKV